MDDTLLFEIQKALQNISYGSLEIIVQDSVVTQMNIRKIQKTKLGVNKKVNTNVTSKIDIKFRA